LIAPRRRSRVPRGLRENRGLRHLKRFLGHQKRIQARYQAQNNGFFIVYQLDEASKARNERTPGGICSGITAGYEDENDIDFGLHYATTGKDDDWRWAEQWLPHAAWYLYAVSIGE
jgi:hypothetical protein